MYIHSGYLFASSFLYCFCCLLFCMGGGGVGLGFRVQDFFKFKACHGSVLAISGLRSLWLPVSTPVVGFKGFVWEGLHS